MIKLDIKSDVREVERFHSNLKKGAVKKAAARAINDALVTVRAEGSREIRRMHPALRIGDIKSNMEMSRATSVNLTGKVETKGKALSLELYRPAGGTQRVRRTKGARGQISLSRGAVRPITAVMGTTRRLVQYNGRKAFRVLTFGNEIFVRANAKGRQLRRFRGPSLPGVFRAQSERFKQIAARRWAVRWPAQMQLEIERSKK